MYPGVFQPPFTCATSVCDNQNTGRLKRHTCAVTSRKPGTQHPAADSGPREASCPRCDQRWGWGLCWCSAGGSRWGPSWLRATRKRAVGGAHGICHMGTLKDPGALATGTARHEAPYSYMHPPIPQPHPPLPTDAVTWSPQVLRAAPLRCPSSKAEGSRSPLSSRCRNASGWSAAVPSSEVLMRRSPRTVACAAPALPPPC